jgi:hypothetical protein
MIGVGGPKECSDDNCDENFLKMGPKKWKDEEEKDDEKCPPPRDPLKTRKTQTKRNQPIDRVPRFGCAVRRGQLRVDPPCN